MSTSSLPDAIWRKSSHSGTGGDCLEVADGLGRSLPVRDSKMPDGPQLAFAASSWSSFIRAVKAGDLTG